ncbi:MAG: type II toxin-antitoxin system HicB family antitoxin [Campylobacterota bacterium]|nr:type II toxin-antitoxin system HicB family antitoxin [Campylobacterota bacterium]
MANIIEYNGYIGSIEYSSEDKCFFGKLEMIDDLVTFEATSADELENNFHAVVDEYIKTCKELNREPQKIYKGVFNVRIDPELHKKIYKEALKAGISLNAFVQKTLQKRVLSNG